MAIVKNNPPTWARGCKGCTIRPMSKYQTPAQKREAKRRLLIAAKPYIDISKI